MYLQTFFLIMLVSNIFLFWFNHLFFRLRVKVGATGRHQKEGAQEINVARHIEHDNYVHKRATYNNDVALLKLANPVKMRSTYILSWSRRCPYAIIITQNVTISFIFLNQGSSGRLNTICLPFDAAPGEKYVAETLTVTGWGYTEVDSKGVRSDIL